MAAAYGLLDDKEENELHKARLLNVEEKPFKRVTKRLNGLHTLVGSRAIKAPTPPPETNGTSGDHDATASPSTLSDSTTTELAQIKEDIILDFAAFDSSILRIQFLLTANERERERYASDRERIISTSHTVRENTSHLRLQLDQARATLEQRRKFDELADKITSNPSLRPRVEQSANLRKLEEEIAELEAESQTYGVTWRERRDQFAKIMDESMRLRRLIRDEQEEVERREGMDDGDAEAGHTPRPGLVSGSNTPRPESGLLSKSGAESGDASGTPRPLSTTGGMTPARDSPAPGHDSQPYLKPPPDASGSFSLLNGNQIPSREELVEQGDKMERDEQEDVDMGEIKDTEEEEPDSPLTPVPEDTPTIVVDHDEDGEDKMDTT
ncbi:Tho complex subunit 7-domain-containing protein [Podospora didyma]|uniref:Tho complex subunit 7-domain-containing protein n=1 Tax=Podospora didyma TaxID=330526 RepID=A0AAE0U896_9PEZI|nr:Tho complex subunit 7-domain-containing protein [Podospora didyma]